MFRRNFGFYWLPSLPRPGSPNRRPPYLDVQKSIPRPHYVLIKVWHFFCMQMNSMLLEPLDSLLAWVKLFSKRSYFLPILPLIQFFKFDLLKVLNFIGKMLLKFCCSNSIPTLPLLPIHTRLPLIYILSFRPILKLHISVFTFLRFLKTSQTFILVLFCSHLNLPFFTLLLRPLLNFALSLSSLVHFNWAK